MKNILIFILVFYCFAGVAQYTHFNNTYVDPNGFSTNLGTIIFEDSSLVSIGLGGLYPIHGLYAHRTSLTGEVIATYFYQTVGFGVGNSDGSVLKTNDGYFMVTAAETNSGSWNYGITGCAKFSNDFNLIWHQQYPEWTNIGESYFGPRAICDYDTASFDLLSVGSYNQENIGLPDSLSWRITRISKSDGSIIDDHIFVFHYNFNITQFRRIGNNYYILGLLGTGGSDGTLLDSQVMLVKTNNEGVQLDQIVIGTPDYCWEGYGAMEVTTDNEILLFYDLCLEQEQLTINDVRLKAETHFMLINPTNMSLIMDQSFNFPYSDEWLNTIHFQTAIIDMENNYLALGAVFLDDQSQFPSRGLITKISLTGELIWQQEYFSDNYGSANFVQEYLLDLVQTPDGGYTATGTTSSYFTTQNHWLLKIDACGYEQPSGCPPVTGIQDSNIQDSKIELWPNPFYNQLKAVLPQNAQRVFISDAMGRIVFEEKVFYPNQTWSLGWLSAGVYVMNVELENGQKIAQRIVKQ